jgi:hypothetical protein
LSVSQEVGEIECPLIQKGNIAKDGAIAVVHRMLYKPATWYSAATVAKCVFLIPCVLIVVTTKAEKWSTRKKRRRRSNANGPWQTRPERI